LAFGCYEGNPAALVLEPQEEQPHAGGAIPASGERLRQGFLLSTSWVLAIGHLLADVADLGVGIVQLI
jgi:hypothetical protein